MGKKLTEREIANGDSLEHRVCNAVAGSRQ